jgi:hypothetical protein
MNTVMNLRYRYHAGKFLSNYTIGDFSRMAELNEIRSSLEVTTAFTYVESRATSSYKANIVE